MEIREKGSEGACMKVGIMCSNCHKHLCKLFTTRRIKGDDVVKNIDTIITNDNIALKFLCDECSDKALDCSLFDMHKGILYE